LANSHIQVGNVGSFSVGDWSADILVAQQAGIDGFALNIAAGDGSTEQSVENAFNAAGQRGFKLFFSFDYAAWNAWPADRVKGLINKYKAHGAYWLHNGRPLVSTFEGGGNSRDWQDIKSSTGCFFMPEWSNFADNSVDKSSIDGLFSWDAWPAGTNDMSTNADRRFTDFLGGKPYMMPVSPWFYTDLDTWQKHWVWGGESLWYDRWQQVLDVSPEYVEIISWNDFVSDNLLSQRARDASMLLTRLGIRESRTTSDLSTAASLVSSSLVARP
jgi:hypothetical protein